MQYMSKDETQLRLENTFPLTCASATARHAAIGSATIALESLGIPEKTLNNTESRSPAILLTMPRFFCA